ncbi:NAD-dependent epimerase/dehydratase family protein [Deinococcus murrayi]|uniref:NAD-dependent epimerase/dehydratase family protein n=1 Tax=Deinococcus murrayi TaxID=68910 RepID=UPI000A06298B|nr:NAD-dependent epimerase/dehydratase family protein [Deinococcus murrayi]
MKVLVTGGAGYIGSTVVSALADSGHMPVLSRGQKSDGDLRSRLLYGVFCDERHPEPTRSV